MYVDDLLALRDAGEQMPGPQRALLLCTLEGEAEQPGVEPVGRTAARLLRLHERIAASVIEGTVDCPSCGATVEFSVATRDLLALEADIVDEPEPLDVAGRQLAWRPVGYADLAAALSADADRAAEVVLSRCVDADAASVDPAIRPRLSDAMAAADPLAEIELDLGCPECESPLVADLDVVRFVWAEVEARAERLLAEIDVLARAYSWSEAAILAMPPARRQRFVALVTGEA